MKNILSFFFLAFLFSCTSIEDSEVSIPDHVLPMEKMSEVMVDIHLLEATLNMNTFSKENVVVNTINPTTDILKKNAVTKKQYDESFQFYSQNPKLLAEVYQLVLNELSKKQAEVMNGK